MRFIPFLVGFLAASLTYINLGMLNSVRGQITTDGTLSTEGSVVVPDQIIKGIPSERIDGGAIRKGNLFHSFTEFNIESGRGAYFTNPSGIENILTRVTGGKVSNIMGTLGVLGNANLFFLNPNGIVFGQSAQLDVNGSFVGSSANSFVFGDGLEFSATNPQAPPLLKINVAIGLQRGTNRGDIANAGNLAVNPGKNLILFGDTVTSTGELIAPGGTVQVLGERVGLLDNAEINVSDDTNGGNVFIGGDFQGRGTLPTAKRTYIGSGVDINADALKTGNGGNVTVWADEVTGFYGNISARGGSASGNGGFVEVSGKEQLIFRGNVDTSALSGFTGTLLLDPTNIIIADGTGDEGGDGTDNFAGNNSGIAGSILSTPLSEINDTAPTTIYESELEGLPGDTNIVLQATNDITVNDLSDNQLNFAGGTGAIAFTADADGDGVGNFVMEDKVDTIRTNGRNIAISGANLTLGNIYTVADNGGSTKLNATNGSISANNINTSSSLSSPGEIIINAARGDITINGKLQSNAEYVFDANSVFVFPISYLDNGGDITLVADGDITLKPGSFISSIGVLGGNISLKSNNGNLSINDSIITSITTASGDKGGDIQLDAQSIYLSDFARVANLTFGQANGGDLIVNASSDSGVVELTMSEDGASSTVGRGNPIFELLKERPFSGTFLATGTFGAGNAGNLSITTNKLIIRNNSLPKKRLSAGVGTLTFPFLRRNLSSPLESIVLNIQASSGNGGNLTVIAHDSVEITGNQPGSFAPELREETADEIIGLLNGLSTTTQGSGNSGNLEIQTPKLIMRDGANVATGTITTKSDAGNGGLLRVTGIDSQELELVSLQGKAILISGTIGPGDAGDLSIRANKVELLDGAAIAADTISSGDAGDLTISTNQLAIRNGSRVSAATAEEGNGGNITVMGLGGNATVNPSGFVIVEGTSTSGSIPSGIFSNSDGTFENAGFAGDITINTRELKLQQRGQISAFSNSGIGGNINLDNLDTLEVNNGEVSASTVDGQAGSVSVNASTSVELRGQGGLAVAATGKGSAGSLTVNARQFSISDGASISASNRDGKGGSITAIAKNFSASNQGQILTTTSGSAQAGNITLKVSDNITLAGTETGLFADTTDNSTGNGGSIFIDPKTLTIRDGATIAVDSQGEGIGGDIDLTAGFLTLDNGSISAKTRSNTGGNITLNLQDLLLLRNGSQISTSAGDDQFGGNGGNITINNSPFIVAVPKEDSDITANAFTGNGGNINIFTQGIFGIQFQERQTPQSDITASSEFGINGNVTISNPEVDPSKGLVELPSNLADPSQQIDKSCNPGSAKSRSSFVSTGRGGLPLSPTELLQDTSTLTQWVKPRTSAQNSAKVENQPPAPTVTTTVSPSAIVEAQGLVVDANGDLYLVAQAPQVNPRSPWQTSASCPVH
ncbi:MAG: filamentous hemagglutinin N-terminal domain-containing protein [Nostocaceae cyanobacterium]|nr:filamentous hemagglutinin N-terminal domain-containing protein [Nostocaceae cyanobacterium]